MQGDVRCSVSGRLRVGDARRQQHSTQNELFHIDLQYKAKKVDLRELFAG